MVGSAHQQRAISVPSLKFGTAFASGSNNFASKGQEDDEPLVTKLMPVADIKENNCRKGCSQQHP